MPCGGALGGENRRFSKKNASPTLWYYGQELALELT